MRIVAMTLLVLGLGTITKEAQAYQQTDWMPPKKMLARPATGELMMNPHLLNQIAPAAGLELPEGMTCRQVEYEKITAYDRNGQPVEDSSFYTINCVEE
jgi:hypothetical protein